MDDAERYWKENAEDLRQFMGFCPLTPSEAQEALKKMPQREASDEDVNAILEAVLLGKLPDREDESVPDWTSDFDFSEMDREAALCRNRGEHDPEGDKAEDDFFNELLTDDDTEKDEDGLGG